MAAAELLNKLFADLGFPSPAVFHKTLNKRGIPITMKKAKEFAASRSERQKLSAPPKYEGRIVSFNINHKWATDLISFVSRPAKTPNQTYTHIIIVQDIFSRFIWAEPLTSVTAATSAFEKILKESQKSQLRSARS